MKRFAFVALLLSGCMATVTVSRAVLASKHLSVSIVATHENTKSPPVKISLRAVTIGLRPPLRFHWSLGEGREWEGAEPPPQSYDGGRYDIILTVTDADGQIKKASVAVDVEGKHEH